MNTAASRADTATWKGGSGTYSTASSWSGGVVPINGGGKSYDVIIDGQTTSASNVTFNSGSSVVVDSLTISDGDRIDFANNNGLSILWSLNNAGTMSFSNGFLSLGSGGSVSTNGGTLITGGGTVLINSTSIANFQDWSIFRASVIGSGTLTNLASVDSGTLTASNGSVTVKPYQDFDNGGTISAVNFGTMTINANSVRNEGLFSVNSGTLIINANSFTNNSQGRFNASLGEIDLNAAYTLSRDDEFTISTGGVVRFRQRLTTAGHTLKPGAGSFVYLPTLTNNGGTISSLGSMTIGNATNVGGTISMAGAGYVDANSTFDNTGGTFSIGGNCHISNYSKLFGGTFTSSNGAILYADAQYGCSIANLTNNGTIRVGDSSNVGGTIGGSGTLGFNSVLAYLDIGTVTLTGTGSTLFTNSTLQGGYAPNGGSVTLINDTSRTFAGYGSLLSQSGATPQLTQTFDNRGTVRAEGGWLNLSANRVNNSGTFAVIDSARLRLIGVASFTGSGTITVPAGSLTVGSSYNGSTFAGTATIALISGSGISAFDHETATIAAMNGGVLIGDAATSLTVDAMNITSVGTNGGTVTLAAGAGKAAARTNFLTVSTMNFNDRAILIDYSGTSPLPGWTAQVRAGAAAGWKALSGAFYSTSAAADPTHHALGIGELSAVFGSTVPATFLGQTVDATTVAIRYTYLGDTNLDGKVDIGDLGTLASHWQQSGPWTSGDFNYDGKIDIGDLGMLATNWQAGVTAPSLSFSQALAQLDFAGAATPEPSVLSLAALLLLRRHRPAYCCS